jgi:putative transposase
VKTVCRLLGVARSNICERLRKAAAAQCEQTRHGDCELVEEIRAVVAERPFYGYRRVTAVLNRGRQGKLNLKRIHRVMRENGLLLKRPNRKPTRAHDGKVMTMASNLRWCSDHFDVRCWNGDVVRVVFSLDTHDREIIAWKATMGGMTGELVRDVIAESVEKRFGDVDRLPRPMQWLSDNGPAYTAKETIVFARMLGFEVCTTPAYSPESNGMAEAFVKTFKRDYVYPARLDSGPELLSMLNGFFEDYNEFAPHKGLKLKSPREYLRSISH